MLYLKHSIFYFVIKIHKIYYRFNLNEHIDIEYINIYIFIDIHSFDAYTIVLFVDNRILSSLS